MFSFRYSEWGGTQEIPPLDPDEVLEALTDDLMNFGDLQHALRNLMQRGMRTPDGMRTPGLRDLLHQLRQQRRQRLDQFDLGGVMEEIERQLQEILDLERGTLDERLEQAGGPSEPAPEGAPDDPGDGAEGEHGEGAEGAQGEPSGEADRQQGVENGD